MAPGRAPARSQRGVATIAAAGGILVALFFIALVVDLGSTFYAQRDLQRLANMAALDASRVASGCLGPVADPGQAAVVEAVASVLRNGGQSGWVTSNSASILGDRVTDGATGMRRFEQGDGSTERAVEVSLSRPGPSRLIPLFGGNAVPTLTVTSAAFNHPQATLFVGERGVDLDPADGSALDNLFRQLFGDNNINAAALNYEELFGYELPADEVFDELGLGTPDSPVDTPVPLPGLIDALLEVASGNLSPATEALAEAIRDAADTSATVVPSEVLGVDNPTSDVLISLGDTLVAAGAAALDGEPIELPLPAPLGSGSTTLRIINPATPATFTPTGITGGTGTIARSAAVVAAVNVPINLSAIGTTGNLQIYVSAVNASGEVDAFNCKRRGEPEDTVDVTASTSLTEIGFGRFDDITAEDPQPVAANIVEFSGYSISVKPPLLPAISVPVKITISASGSAEIGERVDGQSLDGMKEGDLRTLGNPSSNALASGLTDLASDLQVRADVDVLNSNLTSAVLALLNPQIASLKASLENTVEQYLANTVLPALDDSLQPQLTSLGVTLSGADVEVLEIVTDQPVLFTH